MKKLLITLTNLFFLTFIFSQGTTCANAISLPCATTNYSGTTLGAANNAAAGNCGSNYGQWFKFTGDGTSTTISCTTSGFDPSMQTYSGACGSLTSLSCVDGAGSNGTETYTFTTVSGTQYYVFIAYYNEYAPNSETYKGNFTISRVCPTAPCSPVFSLTNGDNNCPSNQFYVDVNITNLGSATSVKIVNNGGVSTITGINTTGMQTIGPFSGGSTVNVIVQNESNSSCTANANILTRTCEPCDYARPFCSDIVYNFPNNVDVPDGHAGPDYGCLGSQPNPVWYFMKIKDAGDLNLKIESSCGDVDYAAWGPFSKTSCSYSDLSSAGVFQYEDKGTLTTWAVDAINASSGNLVDCSYDIAAVEYLYIPNGIVGDYYMVMITNYANCVGNYTFSKVGGSGSTDCGIVLPVVLSKFEVNCNSNEVDLFWETTSERDNDYFTIEHSADGSTFLPVHHVKGKGNSDKINQYNWTDINAIKGLNYYRLKQTDFNGDSRYFEIKQTECKQSNDLVLYPNPAQNKISIMTEKSMLNSAYYIFDYMGKLVLKGDIFSEKMEINLNNLSSGIYLIKTENNLTQTFRIINSSEPR